MGVCNGAEIFKILNVKIYFPFLLQGSPLQNPTNGPSKAGVLQDSEGNNRY